MEEKSPPNTGGLSHTPDRTAVSPLPVISARAERPVPTGSPALPPSDGLPARAGLAVGTNTAMKRVKCVHSHMGFFTSTRS